MDPVTTIFIADDHDIFREALKHLITKDPHFLLVGEATDGAMAIRGITKSNPEIALLDINMPKVNGLKVAEQIRKSKPGILVIMVTSYKEDSLFNQAMDLNANGYVLKDDFFTDLPHALCLVSEGGTFISPAIQSFWNKRNLPLKESLSKESALDPLTPMELRVLRLIADNTSIDGICRQLSINSQCALDLQKSIQAKHHFKSRSELLIFARKHKEELRGFKLVPKDFQ